LGTAFIGTAIFGATDSAFGTYPVCGTYPASGTYPDCGTYPGELDGAEVFPPWLGEVNVPTLPVYGFTFPWVLQLL
jgi:hypothetical protein